MAAEIILLVGRLLMILQTILRLQLAHLWGLMGQLYLDVPMRDRVILSSLAMMEVQRIITLFLLYWLRVPRGVGLQIRFLYQHILLIFLVSFFLDIMIQGLRFAL